jgi:hypothetical protein
MGGMNPFPIVRLLRTNNDQIDAVASPAQTSGAPACCALQAAELTNVTGFCATAILWIDNHRTGLVASSYALHTQDVVTAIGFLAFCREGQ